MYVVDIETQPQPDDYIRSILPPYSHKSKPPGEFNPASVKFGQTKDPTKRAEKLAACQEKHAAAVAGFNDELADGEREYYATAIDRAALSATTGKIAAIGVLDASSSRQAILGQDGNEAKTIEWFFKIYAKAKQEERSIVGFNIFGFDLPFIAQRAMILNVDIPGDFIEKNRYWHRIFVDLADIWTFGRRLQMPKLGELCAVFGMAGKSGSGADFHKLWNGDPSERQQAIDYLKNDLDITVAVARRMGVVA